MNALAFAWRGLVRQPARAVLGIVGVAAAAALLFDMLLLSRGLIVSMQDLLDRGGFSVRVMATEALPGTGPRIGHISQTAAAIAALPAVDEAVPLRLAAAEIASDEGAEPLFVSFFGADSSRRRPWTIVDGRDVAGGGGSSTGEVLLNRQLADVLGRRPGEAVTVRASCGAAGASTLPPIVLTVAGIAEFPFDDPSQLSAATTLSDAMHACGDDGQDDADLILVAGAEGVEADSVRRGASSSCDPDLQTVTNEEVVARLQQADFSYFRQISAVLIDGHAGLRAAAHHGAADGLGQPAARRNRRAARARFLAAPRRGRRALRVGADRRPRRRAVAAAGARAGPVARSAS